MQHSQRIPNYSYQIFWSDEDKEFVATFIEIPSLSGLGRTPREAIMELDEALDAWLEVTEEKGVQPPAPIQRIPLVLFDIASLEETERFPSIFVPLQYAPSSQAEAVASEDEKINITEIDYKEGTKVVL